MSKRGIVALALVISLNFVTVVGPLWWWAINGMDRDIGIAWQFTALAVFVASTPVIATIMSNNTRG